MFLEILVAIAKGLPLTILVTLAALAIGLVLGLLLALAMRSRPAIVRLPARGVVNVVRAVPVLMWLFLLYFGVTIGTFTFDPLTAAIIVLGTTTAAYLAEAYRTAFDAVDRGQFEAARAIGLTRGQELFHVILPQVFRVAIPAMSTFALTLLKDSSIPSVIGVMEISHYTTAVARSTGEGLTAYTAAAVFYLVLSVALGLAGRVLSERLKVNA
ncbi:MAG TPA: amino acid ABC transporter permease [Arachnia sp.]|nr:amino acid ABC transporter permease [Arachnia sp.]HMT87690.1 amino acid ABC transporter permease [Arachnia sp.]